MLLPLPIASSRACTPLQPPTRAQAHPYPSTFDCTSDCLSKWTLSTYDLQTEAALDASFAGGVLGAAKTALAAHGGLFSSPPASPVLTLQQDLSLAYYTSLSVGGDLDCNGHSINVSSFASLTVGGAVRNARNITLGAFATLSVGSGLAAAGAVSLAGGGVCGGTICDNASFALPRGPPAAYVASGAYNYSAINVAGAMAVGSLSFGGCCQNVSVDGDVTIDGPAPVPVHSWEAEVGIGLYQFHLLNATGSVTLRKGTADLQQGYYYAPHEQGAWPVGLKAGKDIAIGGDVHMWQAAVTAGGEFAVAGDLSASGLGSYDGVNGKNFDVAKLTVGGTFSCYRCYDFTLRDVLTVGNFSVDGHVSLNGGVVVTDTLSTSNSGSSISTTSLTAKTADMSYPDNRLGVFSMDVGELVVGSSSLIDVQGADARVGRLRLLSASKLQFFGQNPIVVTQRVEIAPHVLMACNGNDFAAAGSGVLGQPPSPQVNASATCHWPSSLYDESWDAHQPPQSCNAALNVCGSNHSSDYMAPWLVTGYLGQFSFSQCLSGTDGKALFAQDGTNPTDVTKACPAATHKPKAAAAKTPIAAAMATKSAAA